MSKIRKYKSFGVRRDNNLSDISDKEASLNNILNNLPGIDEDAGITFISQDLDAIRGLKDTNVIPESFTQLAQSTPISTVVDSNGNIVLDENGNEILRAVTPLVRIEDRISKFRTVTEDAPAFTSGQGPKASFVPSTLIPSFTKLSNISDNIEAALLNPAVQVSNDFWTLGEFIINDRLRPEFSNSYGGILWEGYYIPNPNTALHIFSYETSGLFHVEYDRFGDGNWEIVKSIYAKKRNVIVETSATASTEIILQNGETRFLSVGDFVDGSPDNVVVGILNNTVTLTNPITVSAGQSLVFDMLLGESTVRGGYQINEILDFGENPQMKKRIFWWFPDVNGYTPTLKYLRNVISPRSIYEYFFLNQEPATEIPQKNSIRELLDLAVTPSAQTFGNPSDYKEFKSSLLTESLYTPKSSIAEITKQNTTITFNQGNRSATGNFSTTEVGNIIIPTAVTDFEIVVKKDTKIKYNNNSSSTVRIINQAWSQSQTSYPVSIIDHNGIVDYFVASSTNDVVSIASNDSTLRLKKNMICITEGTTNTSFVRITEVISNTEFRVSQPLNIQNKFVFVYANSGITDNSLDFFCAGVFGQALATESVVNQNTLELVSVSGIQIGQVVQFDGAIDENTTVANITGNIVTLSKNIVTTIKQGETIVFAPAGTSVNKSICVLPLDTSPPFVGTADGLDTDQKSILSTQTPFNVRVNRLEFKNTTVNTASILENYDRKIPIANNQLSIIAKKV
jgi:hypothetical protein